MTLIGFDVSSERNHWLEIQINKLYNKCQNRSKWQIKILTWNYLQVCVISSSSGIDSVFSSGADILLFPVLTDCDFTIFLAHNIDIKSDEAIWSTSVYNISQQSLKFSKQSKVVEIWKSWKSRTPSFEKNNMNIFSMTNIHCKQKTINRNMWFINLRCMIYTCSYLLFSYKFRFWKYYIYIHFYLHFCNFRLLCGGGVCSPL